MTTPDDELLALARKATQGTWEATDGVVWMDAREQVCCGRSYTECCGQYDIKGGQEKIADSGETDAAYIAAAHPAAIIALIERHRAEVERLETALAERNNDCAEHAAECGRLGTLVNQKHAEVERLTRENTRLFKQHCGCTFDEGENPVAWCAHHAEIKERADAVEAALSAAQKRIAELLSIIGETLPQAEGCWHNHYGDNPEGSPVPSHIARMRAALAGKEDG